MLGIIGGTSLLHANFSDLEKKIIHTPYGSSELLFSRNVVLLLRHQFKTPPHRINYRSHIAALALSGIDRIIAIGSTGSLKEDIKPGSLVIPHDFVNMASNPTLYDHSIGHVNSELSESIRKTIGRIVPDARCGGTYVQTEGPRLETPAEIRYLASIGDLVGMTIASEAIISSEMGIPFAAICTVDNYANGISDEEVTYDKIVEFARIFQARTDDMLFKLICGCS